MDVVRQVVVVPLLLLLLELRRGEFTAAAAVREQELLPDLVREDHAGLLEVLHTSDAVRVLDRRQFRCWCDNKKDTIVNHHDSVTSRTR